MIEPPGTISLEKREFLQAVLKELEPVPGVAAVVLGGSYASGTQREDSDLDLAIYYDPERPFAIGKSVASPRLFRASTIRL